MKLIKEDEVEVIRGKEKGKKGKIEKVIPSKNMVLLPGINLFKKHYKSPTQNKPSEIIEITKPLPVSNVMLVCPKCHKKTRIGYKFDNKEKVRICKKCNKKI